MRTTICRVTGDVPQEISVDELSEKIKRATELIKICENKLSSAETEVAKVIESSLHSMG